jgi:Lrp/AsnC family leucine-responsive transcriptional regulator|nr:Lrp/AsnC family transcriptional regulator [Acidipropionibacterium acidipropionici]
MRQELETMTDMESTDRQILALLEADGRMSWTELGRETGLSASAAQQRVRRLETKGVIKGYHADLDLEAVDASVTAFIFILPTDPQTDEEIPGLLRAMPQVRSCHSVAGSASYLIRVQAASPTDLDRLLSRIRKDCHCSTETTVVLDTVFDDLPLMGER